MRMNTRWNRLIATISCIIMYRHSIFGPAREISVHVDVLTCIAYSKKAHFKHSLFPIKMIAKLEWT